MDGSGAPSAEGLPPPFNGTYFSRASWSERLERWRESPEVKATAFAEANEASIRRRLDEPDTAARVVVNIRAVDLGSFLRSGQYLNAYELETHWGPSPPGAPHSSRQAGWHWQ